MVTSVPETRYARSGELSIAYQVVGDGPMDVVVVPGFVSHVELAWELPPFAGMLQGLGSFARVIAFDKRGTGLSDRTAGLPTLAERMDDIRAVMDAAGSDRAAIVGISEGGPTAMLFAATYPERTSALVLWAPAIAAPIGDRPHQEEAAARFDEFIGRHWGEGKVMRALLGSAPDDEGTTRLIARFERNAATPSAAQAMWRRALNTDPRPFASAVRTPTLVVLHDADPFVLADDVAPTVARIPDARTVTTDAPGHSAWDVAGVDDLDLIEEFLTGTRPVAAPTRVLATVLFTDIVDSTRRAAALGDERWRAVLDRHDELVAREVGRHGGVVVKATGDGALARFDGPARAVACAQVLRDGVATLGLELRAGAHTGEVELRGDDIGGIAVHVASRVSALAAPGEVLVSSTVKDLVLGSGIAFAARGEHELKGVPDTWRLFTVTSA